MLTISTYQRRGGKGLLFFDSTYASEKQIDREKLYKRFLKFKYPPALDYKLDIFHPFVLSVDKLSPSPTTLSLPYVLPRSGIRS